MSDSLSQRALRHLWHPCSQMKDYEDFPPLTLTSAKGAILKTSSGDCIDIISSWWCKSLGHGHPQIIAAVKNQLDKFEHVILANTTNEPIVALCEKIIDFCPAYDKIFFCDSGSDAVEVAMKMALQYQLQTGNGDRTEFMSLENGYHGETVLTLAAGDCGLYGRPFESMMPKITKIKGLPYVNSHHNWPGGEIAETAWLNVEAQLEEKKKTLAALVLEPVLQGAGGMLLYKPLLLKKLSQWCTDNGVLLIADEILAGMGRLGYARASEMADVVPDIAVFSKGLSAGFSPIACALTTNKIYQAFYDDYSTGKAFMHSNTYCGNAVGVAASGAALEVYQSENIFAKVRQNAHHLIELFEHIAAETGALNNIRGQGFVVAADLKLPGGGKIAPTARVGYSIYQQAVKRGLLMRPLGNTIYFLPPLNTPLSILERSADIAIESIRAVLS